MPRTQKDFTGKLKHNETYGSFVVETIEPLDDLEGYGYLLRHQPSGARVLWIATSDINRAFAISFKTPPISDTGVFHIIEHSVLCGSEHYPVKEPFVNLLKSSMNTFLNALTFSDKTMYPVASTNVNDLENLMSVYLDAVFHPQMYHKPSIFAQEGWHLELPAINGELSYNGVVYNEMKGSLSDPETYLYVQMKRSLFPDSCYKFESGGNPDSICDLTYDEFLDAHNRHYQLANSYSILYGDLDIERELAFLEKHFEAAEDKVLAAERGRETGTPHALGVQKPVCPAPLTVAMSTSSENAMVGLGYVVGPARERKKLLATTILLEALFGSNEAPLKRALMEAHLGNDITAELIDDQGYPFVLIQLKGSKEEAATPFKELFESEVERICADGIDTARLEAALSQTEFAFREQDFGSYPAGVAYAISVMGTWLYDENDVFVNLHFQKELQELREGIGLGIFEDYLREIFLSNPHKALVELVPSDAPASQKESERLKALRSELSAADLERIMQETEELHTAQSAPDHPEDLKKIPTLSVDDLQEAPALPQAENISRYALPCSYYNLETHRISYTATYFSLEDFAYEETCYLGLLCILLGKLDTRYHTAAELDTLINANLGDISFEIGAFAQHDAPLVRIAPRLIIVASALSEKTVHLATIPYEIALQTLFEDTDKIKAILKQQKIALEQGFVEAGHAAARARARSYYSVAERFIQQVDGIDFYRFICDLLEHWDKKKNAIREILYNLQSRLFRARGASLSFAGTRSDLEVFWKEAGSLGLPDVKEAMAAVGALNADATQPNSSKNDEGGNKGKDTIDAEDAENNAIASLNNPADSNHDKSPANTDTNPNSRLQIPAPSVLNEGLSVPANVCFCSLASPGTLLTDPLHYSGTWLVASRAITYEYLWNEVRVLGGAYGAGFAASADTLMSFYSYRDPAIDPTITRFLATGAWLASFRPAKREMDGYIVATVAGLDNPRKPRQIMLTRDHLRMCGFPANWETEVRNEALKTTADDLVSLAPTLQDIKANHGICVIGGKDFFKKSTATKNSNGALGCLSQEKLF